MTSDILLIGLGQIGSIVAAHLLQAGHQITLAVHSEEKAAYFDANGLHISGIKEMNVPVAPKTLPEIINSGKKFSYILVCTKALANKELAPNLLNLLDNNGVIICMQNGLGVENPFIDYFVIPTIGRAVLNFAGVALNPGHINMTYLKDSYLGSCVVGEDARVMALAKILNESGLPFKYVAKIQDSAWEKTILGGPISAISALTGQTIGQVIDDPNTCNLVRKLFDEFVFIAKAKGVAIASDFWPVFIEYNVAAAGHIPSMRGDIENNRVTEAAFTIGQVVRQATDLGYQVPHCSLINTLLLAIDNKNA